MSGLLFCRECSEGKHVNCDGTAWDNVADAPTACTCPDPSHSWTGCVHCGQTLPHEGTDWRASYRCRLFQRIAEHAWDEGYEKRAATLGMTADPNPYRAPAQPSEPERGER